MPTRRLNHPRRKMGGVLKKFMAETGHTLYSLADTLGYSRNALERHVNRLPPNWSLVGIFYYRYGAAYPAWVRALAEEAANCQFNPSFDAGALEVKIAQTEAELAQLRKEALALRVPEGANA